MNCNCVHSTITTCVRFLSLSGGGNVYIVNLLPFQGHLLQSTTLSSGTRQY